MKSEREPECGPECEPGYGPECEPRCRPEYEPGWVYMAYLRDDYMLRGDEGQLLPFKIGVTRDLDSTLRDFQRYHFRVVEVFSEIHMRRPEAMLAPVLEQLERFRIADTDGWFNLAFSEAEDISAHLRVISELDSETRSMSRSRSMPRSKIRESSSGSCSGFGSGQS